MAENPVGIPQAMRDVSEQNLQQAHAAYKQLMDFVSKTMNAWMEAMPENAMSAGFKDMQGRAMDIAMENAESTFTFAGKVNSAQTFQEIATLQTQFAQERVQAFVTQTQQLFSIVGEAFQKSERGAFGAGASATPSNLMVTAFKDVTDSAVPMAKTNAESASAPVEKIANPVGIPQAMREQAEQNLQQAHAAHEQFTDLVTNAMDAWKGVMRAGLAAARSKDVQDRAMEIAKKHAESASALAEVIAKAQNFPAPSDNELPADTPNSPPGSSQEIPLRRKSAKSKTAMSGTSTTPPLPSPTPLAPQRSPRSKPKAVKKEAAARGAASLKDE